MLELREYSFAELSELLGSKDNQAIKRKLNSWGITYEQSGHGASSTFKITDIKDPFKIYCLTELGFAPQTDFEKLKYVYYYFFNDDDFKMCPDVSKEKTLDKNNHYASRQAIARYIDKLEQKDLIHKNSGNFMYYFAYKDILKPTDIDTYKQAWKEYFFLKEWGATSEHAISQMRQNYGGIARKHEIPDINGIYSKEIEYLNTLIQKSIEADIEQLENE